MSTSRIFNKILTEDLNYNNNKCAITDILVQGKARLFSKNIESDGLFTSETLQNEQKMENKSNTLIKENEQVTSEKDIIYTNRVDMDLLTITQIIPFARGKYDTISDFIFAHKRSINFHSSSANERFIFSLASKRTITSQPTQFDSQSFLVKSASTAGTTVAKTTINSLALGSFQMMSNLLASTIGAAIGVLVSFVTIAFTIRKQGGSRTFKWFTYSLLGVQAVVSIVVLVCVALYYNAFWVTFWGIFLIVVFWIINQIGKILIKFYDDKLAVQIERMYDGYLYSKVRNYINKYE